MNKLPWYQTLILLVLIAEAVAVSCYGFYFMAMLNILGTAGLWAYWKYD